MPVTIRTFRREDLARLQEITVVAFEGVSIDHNIEQRLGPVPSGDWRSRKAADVAYDAQRDPQGIFVAVQNDEILGYISTWMDRLSGVGYIPNLAIVASARGQGIGRRLLEHAVEHFRRHGMVLARIETLEQNPVGRHLYPSVGFVEVARQIHYAMRLDVADVPHRSA
jgi:ribosomal protein S18 acetylase RimI-like enzyme